MKTLLLFLAFLSISSAAAAEPDFSEAIQELKAIAALPEIVAAAELRNEKKPAELASLTNESWTELSVTDPLVVKLTNHPAVGLLKARLKPYVTEAFLSAADGTKIAFLSKTTSWTHKGKPKHEDPMRGKIWQGKMEKDASTGIHQTQISAPVLKDGKPIGSLVFGISMVKWEQRKK